MRPIARRCRWALGSSINNDFDFSDSDADSDADFDHSEGGGARDGACSRVDRKGVLDMSEEDYGMTKIPKVSTMSYAP